MKIGIAKPFIGHEEKQAVQSILESGQLVQGKEVAQFEEEFAAYHHARHAVAMSSGTTALMAIMMAHDFRPGDEVIVPAFSFFATASAVASVGAVPVFADIDEETYCLSPEAAEAAITERTVAIMPVHLYGHPAELPRFAELCEKHGLALLEDAAQAVEASIDGTYVGNWGTAAFSFYPSKNMTTAEGGMVVTNDDTIAERARMIRHQGMNKQYFHEVMGFNFRMTNIAAAIGRVQLQRLPDWTQQRIANASYFNERLRHVVTPRVSNGYRHVYHQYTVRVGDGLDRDAVVDTLNKRGIGARIYYPMPIHQQPVFQQQERYQDVVLPVTERLTQQVLSLPVHPFLTDEERDYIVQEVNSLC